MSLRLTRELRKEIFAGGAPPIRGEGPCPVEAGHVMVLSSKVELKVTAVRRRRSGGWSLQYELLDRRDPRRILRRTPGIYSVTSDDFDDHGDPKPLDADELGRASELSSYTGGGSSLADAGEAVDAKTQERFTQQATERLALDHMLAEMRRERYELEKRLERARADAELRGVDISSPLRVIERQLAKIERRVYEGKAA